MSGPTGGLSIEKDKTGENGSSSGASKVPQIVVEISKLHATKECKPLINLCDGCIYCRRLKDDK